MKKQAGSLYVILSAALFGMMPLIAKIAYAHGGNAYTVAFGRFLFGAAILGIVVLLLPGHTLKISAKQAAELFKLSLSYAATPILLYSSYNYIDSGAATSLHFTYPVAVMLIMAAFCKKKPGKRQIICAALCVAGLALLFSPENGMSALGMILALASGLVYAVYIVLLGRSSAKGLQPLTLAFWISLFSAAEIGAAAALTKNLTLSFDKTGLFAILAMALFATVFALVLFQVGLFIIGEVKASILSTFEPLTGILIGIIAFDERLSLSSFLGIACILAAVILLVINPKKQTNIEGG